MVEEGQFVNDIAEIKVSLATIIAWQASHGEWHTRDDTVTADVETRLRNIERWKYAIPSSIILAVGSVVASIMAAG